MCERNFCMFKHKMNVESHKVEENDNLDEDTNVIVDEAGNEDKNEELEECMNDTMNRTFSNPSQDLIDKKFQCENCSFRAETKSDLNNHKTTIHNWCPFCYSSFVTQERLSLHKRKKHSKL